MERTACIAAAIAAVPEHDAKGDKELAAEICAVTETPNPRTWKPGEIAQVIGWDAIEGMAKADASFVVQLIRGVDLSDEKTRERFKEHAAVLELGVVCSSPWLAAGGDGEPPTAEEIREVRDTLLASSAMLEKAREFWNAVVDAHSQSALTADVFAKLREGLA